MAEKKVTETAPAIVENLTLDLSMFDSYRKEGGIIQGMESMDSSDLKMPRVKLLQSNSEETQKGIGKAGQFYNSVTGEVKDELEVVLLVMGKSRVRFDKPYKRGASPLCRSLDSIASVDGEACKTCPYADWDKARENNQNSPDCRESITWMFLERNAGSSIPPRIIISGASMSDHKNFISKIVGLGGYPPYIFVTRISSHQETNDSGIFYVIDFDFAKDENGNIKLVTPEEAKRFEGLSKQWGSMSARIANYDTEKYDDSIVDSDSEGAIY